MGKADETQSIMPLIKYDVGDAVLQEMARKAAKARAMDATTTVGYIEVRQGIHQCRNLRTLVEKRRKFLKKDAMDFGRDVDAEAKRIIALIMEIESPLKALKSTVDDAKATIRIEKKRKEDARVLAIRAKLNEIHQHVSEFHGKPAPELRVALKKLKATEIGEEFQESQNEARQVINMAIANVAAMLKQREDMDAELEDIAKTKAKVAEQLRQQHEKQAKMDKEKELVQKARAKIQAENKRMQEERACIQTVKDVAAKIEKEKPAVVKTKAVQREAPLSDRLKLENFANKEFPIFVSSLPQVGSDDAKELVRLVTSKISEARAILLYYCEKDLLH